ncbi:DUF6114 domain-containing protein [Nocardiopsis halotolerans]|uniref:DUF6114 domain-containing protein n=1 Tax=Nocardiopsis halotolerans TaxID=124252 RepID=UPI0003461BE3|nr:DUF6114 domain-containing protein [Nocardiopsis halotolerans]
MAHALTLFRAGWGRFRSWRRRRPFWGGLLLVLAGVELLVAPAAQSLIIPIDLLVYSGIAGVSGVLIATLLIALGVLSWFQTAQHFFFGVVGLMLALVSYVTSNFGGFVIGMLLGIVGGALVFAWAPTRQRRPRRAGCTRRTLRRRKEATDRSDASEDGAAGGSGDSEEGTGRRTPAVSSAEARTGTASPRGAGAAERGASDEVVSDPRSGTRPLAALALPLAVAVTLASASAPSDWWDWFLPSDDEEEQTTDQPSPSPSPSAEPTDGPSGAPSDTPSDTPSGEPTEPGTEPDGGTGGEDGGRAEDGTPEGTDEEAEEETGEDPQEGVPEQCRMRTGESALTESEEEFLDAVRDCQAAREAGELPDVQVDERYDCFTGSVRTSGLTADRLTMSGASYDGVVECPTVDGPRRYIRLTMSRADFVGAELWFEDAGTRMSLGLPTMAMDGSVRMHITRMHVRILGIPITFTPDFPPPLLLPYMIVTDVDVDDPMASTDVMNIPDLNGRYGDL